MCMHPARIQPAHLQHACLQPAPSPASLHAPCPHASSPCLQPAPIPTPSPYGCTHPAHALTQPLTQPRTLTQPHTLTQSQARLLACTPNPMCPAIWYLCVCTHPTHLQPSLVPPPCPHMHAPAHLPNPKPMCQIPNPCAKPTTSTPAALMPLMPNPRVHASGLLKPACPMHSDSLTPVSAAKHMCARPRACFITLPARCTYPCHGHPNTHVGGIILLFWLFLLTPPYLPICFTFRVHFMIDSLVFTCILLYVDP